MASDLRVIVLDTTESFEETEDRMSYLIVPRGTPVASPPRGCVPTLFEKLGAPTDLHEWAKWYAADRERRDIPNPPESSRRIRQRTP